MFRTGVTVFFLWLFDASLSSDIAVILILNKLFAFSCQTGAVTSSNHDGYWNNGAQVQTHNVCAQPPQYQTPNPTYQSFQDQHKSASSQGPNVQYPATHQVPQSYPSSLQTVPQNVPPLDSRRVSQLQIPTNPRIASNFALGFPPTNRDSSTSSAAAKPAYISVSLPKLNDKALSNDNADSTYKVRTGFDL